MFHSISWQQYFLFLAIATAVYYLFVWVVYFKAKLPSLSVSGNFSGFSLHGEDQPDEAISTAQHIIEEIKPVFSNRHNKNELVMALQKSLQRYNQWDEPGFRETVNEFIAAESETTCSIRLGEEDLRAVWLG